MAINPLTTSNTFQNWLSATNSLISVANNFTDGPRSIANTLLILTGIGTSLNVRNNAVINTLTSNTITSNNIIITGSGISLNITDTALMANANVTGTLIANNFVVLGTQTIGTVSFNNLDVTGYVNAGSYLKATSFVQQLGANSTFAGNVFFSNTGTSIYTLGNVSIGKILTITGNTSIASDLVVSGNTSIGPYTETISSYPSVVSNQDLNLRTACVFQVNVATSSAIILTLTNPPASRAVSATIYLKNGVGGTSITLRGNTSTGSTGKLRYSYDTGPTLNTSLNYVNILSAFTLDGGSNWYVSAPIIGSNTA